MTADILMNEFMRLNINERKNFMTNISKKLKEMQTERENKTDIRAQIINSIGDSTTSSVAKLILDQPFDSCGSAHIVVPEFTETTSATSEEDLINSLNALTWYKFKSERENIILFDYFIIYDGIVDIQLSEKARELLSGSCKELSVT